MSPLEALQSRLNVQVYNYTYGNYCQRYSSSDYSVEIRSARLKIEELIEFAHLSNLHKDLNTVIGGYLNIKVDIDEEFPLNE